MINTPKKAFSPLASDRLSYTIHFRNAREAYTRHRITNATAGGLNSKIQAISNNARGLPKFETFRIRVLFHCGGLDLNPG